MRQGLNSLKSEVKDQQMKNSSMKSVFKAGLAVCILLAGLSVASPAAYGAGESAKKEAKDQDRDYLVGPEDVLEILVWKNAELSKVVTVRPDGKISLPLIGDIQAAGLTPNQLREAVVKRLKEYQENAVVSVIVQTINSYRIFVVGEVRSAGTYVLKNRTTVLQAISLAGGFTQFASKNKIVLIRQKSYGTEEKIQIRFDDLVYGDEMSEKNLTLKAGDTIFVP